MKFHLIRQALEYQSHCPICSSPMLIDDHYAEAKTDWQDGKQTLKLIWRSEDGEKMVLDPDSSHIVFVEKFFAPEYVTGTNYGGQPSLKGAKKIYDGHLYERMGMTCDDCCKYHYLVKFVIDVGMKTLIDIELNSETISLEDGKGTIHEIKNIYPIKETQYAYFPKGDRIYLDGTHVGEKSISLPLIPLDVYNPTKTLERIRTLVLFS